MGSGATARAWRAPPSETILFAGLALGLGVLVFATPFNHDEDQYLAAGVLAAKARLYRDFLYVQTPLQPELTAPLTGLAPGWTYLVLRLFSAACGLAALAGVWTAQRRLGVQRRLAGLSVLLMASCYTFQYCASVVRNDALPMALLAWAIAEAARGLGEDTRRPWLHWSAGGLLLGLAVSAKVSFAPLLAAAGVFLLTRLARDGADSCHALRLRYAWLRSGRKIEQVPGFLTPPLIPAQAGTQAFAGKRGQVRHPSKPHPASARVRNLGPRLRGDERDNEMYVSLNAAQGTRTGDDLRLRAQVPGLCLGGILGLSPIALAWIGAPEAVRFALVGFWADGPRRWYVANGLEHRMEPVSKLLYGLGDLLLGPALAALVLILLSRLRPSRPASPAAWLLDLMVLAALVAAFAPSPTYKQYFAPLLPPLFVRLGLAASEGRRPVWAQGALALGAAVGLVVFAMRVGQAAWTGRWTPLAVARENRWIGQTLRQAKASGDIATLSAHAGLDSGFPLDPRFAGGAMVYRSADGIDPALRERLHITSPASLAADLDAAPPAAIVVGYEDGGGDTRIRLDAPLRAYAQSRGYAPHFSPRGAAQLYVRPQGGAPVPR